jgi:hypothetical protein
MQIRSLIFYLFAGSAVLEFTPAAFMMRAGILEADADFKSFVGVEFLQNLLGGVV